ncbi:30S ribosomal protein S6 [bacterium]|nr:MAG: 30S ribosomal protein S6 [bacterium]
MSKKTRRGLPGQLRSYETVVVVDPQIGDDVIKSIVEKTKEVIAGHNGTVTKVEDWGKRKLAYIIDKKTYGQYTCIEFEGPGEVVKGLTDYYHISENILRHITLLIDSRLREERKREKAPAKEPGSQDEMFV